MLMAREVDNINFKVAVRHESVYFKFASALLGLRPNVCITFQRNDIATQLWWIIYHISTRQETNRAVACYRANDSDLR